MYRKEHERFQEDVFSFAADRADCVATGMRIAEIFGLKWTDVHVRRGIVRGTSKAEGRQDALRSDAAGVGRRSCSDSHPTVVDRERTADLSAEAGREG